MSSPRITIYTDGGSHPNPGPGGWGAVLLAEGADPIELSGGELDSTNNRMELMAAIQALQSLESPTEVELITDSTYLKQGITKWIEGWKRRGWKTTDKQPVKNQDLWMALDAAVAPHKILWKWTRGHTGDRWNEKAHELAAAAIERPGLPLDDDGAVHVFLGVAWSGKRRTGAWGAVLRFGEHRREISGQVDVKTSNATHIASATMGLEALTRSVPAHIYTVSDYLSDGANRWVAGWRRNGWKTSTGNPVASRDWWERLAALADQLDLRWHVIKGDETPAEIERARELAREALAP